ncbi:MAG: YaiO family outer membrane beta-barrel protein, partial [Halomonas sp.]|nr:YaiO family outer membrane beta-barrel protein [Halomonas sp.]
LVPLERALVLAPDYALLGQVAEQARAALQAKAQVADTPPVEVSDEPVAVAPTRRTELELSTRHDWLDSGYDDWQAQRLDFVTSQPQGMAWYGALQRERRFGTWDHGASLGAVIPLNEVWAIQPEVGVTPGAAFQARWHADLRVQRRLPQGFVGGASLRRTQYEDSRVDRLALGIERYWADWRAGYTLNVSDVENAGTPVGHNLNLDYYYAGPSHVGLRTTLGREEESLGGDRVIASDVASVALRGRHWFTPRWAASWELGFLDQGDFYQRQWLQLGLRHAF